MKKVLYKLNEIVYNIFRHLRAGVAQLVEQLICNQQVVGSSPIASSIWADSRVVKGSRL